MDIQEILSRCDHTLLRVDCTAAEIRELCDDAIRFGCASVCIPPAHVAGAKRYVGDKLKICTVIGFPNGYSTPVVKAFEANDAVRNGADEIDRVKRACDGRLLKVIIECCLLTEEEKIRMCEIVSASGAEYIKTSTGFSKGGATFEDVALLRANCAPEVKVKAAGGISTLEDAEKFIELGAERLGTSRIVKIAKQTEELGEETEPKNLSAPY